MACFILQEHNYVDSQGFNIYCVVSTDGISDVTILLN